MKKITKNRFALIISMLFMIAITSCDKEEPAVGQDDLSAEADQEFSWSLIRVTGHTSGGGTTKTTLEGLETWWKGADNYPANPDKVGIYSPQALPDPKVPAGVVNAEFTAVTTGKSSDFNGEMYWATGDHDFYSYYPYAAGTPAATVVPISLASEQTQSAANNSAHIGALDFMVATPLNGVDPGSEGGGTSGINFRYNHVFTLLEFQVTGTGSLTKVKLSGTGTLAFGGGTIDITQGTTLPENVYTIAGSPDEYNEVTVELVTPVDLDVDPVSVYMMINPGEQIGHMAIGLEVDGAYMHLLKAPPVLETVPALGFDRGKKYEVPLDAEDFAPNTVAFKYRGQMVIYGIVEGAEGRLWMDRNLGASRKALTSDDTEAYGDLFQWGRPDDGHQDRGSVTTTTLSPTIVPVHGDFILSSSDPFDWLVTPNDDLWKEGGGTIINNVCPAGWRVPTDTELDEERASWGTGNYNAAGAFASPLKLPVAGSRTEIHGSHFAVGSHGYYWSSTLDGTSSRYLNFHSSWAGMSHFYRARGHSVRCLKDD